MKVAILTGASSGLGWEFALRIRKTFPDIEQIWLVARRADRLEKLASLLGDALGGTRVLPLDLCGDFEEEYAALLEHEKPRVSLLINCAGCGYLDTFETADPAELRRMTELNITALTLFTRLTLPYMGWGGRIINVSSIASFVPTPRMAVYSSTKSYVSALSAALREELRGRGIVVTCVCPGPMNTEFLDVGNIKGNSNAFKVLPYCNPGFVASGALHASLHRHGVYTPRLFYKLYRGIAKLAPQNLLIKFTGV